MAVKPETFAARQNGKLLQPAVQRRGPKYWRMIDGLECLNPQHLAGHKVRSLNCNRLLALREFALGLESLARFVQQESLYRVHERAFAVLAFESEPVDPRL